MLGGIGAALGGIGSIASGFGLGDKGTSRKRERDSARIAGEEARRHAEKAPSAAVRGFQKAGIHPLFGLTGTSGITAMPSYSTPSEGGGTNFAAVGQGIQRAVTAFTGRAEREVAAKSAQLGLEHQQLQNDYLRTQIQHMNSPGQPPGISGGHVIPGQGDSAVAAAKAAIASMDTPYGRTQGAFPLHKTAYDERGDAVRVFNEEDLGDNDIAQIMHFLRYTVPDYAHNYGRRVAKKVRKYYSR